MQINEMSLDFAYPKVLNTILRHGAESAPRGMKTKEIMGAQIMLVRPHRSILKSPLRRINYAFSVAEWLWMLLGRNDVATIAPWNSKIAQFSDDGVVFSGAYGPPLATQLPYVIDTLRRDPDSRQAVLTIWRPRPGPTKDVPCTVMMQFLLRGGLLHTLVYMRSNDAWLGLPYDVFNFTSIQRYVAAALDVPAGHYRHMVGSLHLYEQHFELAAEVAKERPDVVGGRSPYYGVEAPSLTYPVPAWVEQAFLSLSAKRYPPVLGAPSCWASYIQLLHWYGLRKYPLVGAGTHYPQPPSPWGELYDLRRNDG